MQKLLPTILLLGLTANNDANAKITTSNTLLPQQNIQRNADLMIEKLYRSFPRSSTLTMAQRLNHISAKFLGKPYILGALGEGKSARYDQSPLYRTDGFDCETFVDTVLAIAFAETADGFTQCINKVRYQAGQIEFVTRNHITDLDWNQNNQKQGYLKDITQDFKDNHNQPVAQIASAVINKPSWYQHMPIGTIKLGILDPTEQERRLKELQNKGRQLQAQESQIAYIPLTALFSQKGQPNQALFNQIPHAAIIEIIRPNWDLQDQIGTHLNVSHLGFAFWKQGTLIFRQASSQYHQVVDVSLINYLREARQSPTIKGINIQVVVPKKPYDKSC